MRFSERGYATKYLESFGYTYSLEWGWSKIHTTKDGSYRRVAIVETDGRSSPRPWTVTFYNRSSVS